MNPDDSGPKPDLPFEDYVDELEEAPPPSDLYPSIKIETKTFNSCMVCAVAIAPDARGIGSVFRMAGDDKMEHIGDVCSAFCSEVHEDRQRQPANSES